MNSTVKDMLARYNCRTLDDHRNALKEIMQEIALLGLYRGGFYNSAAFCGGTALRIFHNTKRFSEDLDFSLIDPDPNFRIGSYSNFIQKEMGAFGFDVHITSIIKSTKSTVDSAFIKANTLTHLINVVSLEPPISGVPNNELLKVKLEIDIDPPPFADYEVKYQLLPIPFHVRLYDPPSLFAGKLHALLCRSWGQNSKPKRTKGRDLYDYLWYLSKGIPVNLKHLKARLVQTGHWVVEKSFSEADLIELLVARFREIDYEQAGKDVFPFIPDPKELGLWQEDFFRSITLDKLEQT